MSDHQLDCKGLNCPMPIVKISRAIKLIEAGQTLEVEATDPAFKADVEAWTKKMGHTLVRFTEGEIRVALLKKT